MKNRQKELAKVIAFRSMLAYGDSIHKDAEETNPENMLAHKGCIAMGNLSLAMVITRTKAEMKFTPEEDDFVRECLLEIQSTFVAQGYADIERAKEEIDKAKEELGCLEPNPSA